MIARLQALEDEFKSELEESSAKDAVLSLKTKYLGRKGLFAALLKEIPTLAPEDRGAAGKAINILKRKIEEELDSRIETISKTERLQELSSESIDVTLPGRIAVSSGRLHPTTMIMDEIEDIFLGLGFDIAEGPELESDYYNFEALNIPKDHPAREMQDTFYIDEEHLLRTHTSPVQIHVMENSPPPLRVIAPGAVYRRDSDVTHTPMFHQVEGFMVDRGVTFADLKGLLTLFLQRLFGKKTPVRFRPSFFPFTEPSAEVDIGCVICRSKDSACRVCKGTGWLEILGSGLIHPRVFESVNYDSTEFTGFAFGLGIERIAMLKYGIDDIRLFYENDLDFLTQF